MKIYKSQLWKLVLLFIVVAAILFLFRPTDTNTQSVGGVTVSNDIQYVDIQAKAGYSPRTITAQADKDTVIKIKTNNTFDCSLAFTIPSMGIVKNLPMTGETEIAIGKHNVGEEVLGTCSMGMYSFVIKFS